jgi:hypothetical protein
MAATDVVEESSTATAGCVFSTAIHWPVTDRSWRCNAILSSPAIAPGFPFGNSGVGAKPVKRSGN